MDNPPGRLSAPAAVNEPNDASNWLVGRFALGEKEGSGSRQRLKHIAGGSVGSFTRVGWGFYLMTPKVPFPQLRQRTGIQCRAKQKVPGTRPLSGAVGASPNGRQERPAEALGSSALIQESGR